MRAVHRPKQARTVIHRMLRPIRQILQNHQQQPIPHTLRRPIHRPMYKTPAQHCERHTFKQHIQTEVRQGKRRTGQAVLERIQTQTAQIRVRQLQHNHQHKQRHTIRINNLLIQPIRHTTPHIKIINPIGYSPPISPQNRSMPHPPNASPTPALMESPSNAAPPSCPTAPSPTDTTG